MMGINKVNGLSLFPKVGESKTKGLKLKGRGERYKRDPRSTQSLVGYVE